MSKNHVVIVQNTELGGHLALSTFLTGLLKRYKNNEDFRYSLICGYIDKEEEIGDTKQHIKIYEMGTHYNKIKDNIIFTKKAFQKLIALNKKQPIKIVHCLYPNSSLQAAVLFKIFIKPSVKIIYDVRSPWIEMSFANSRIPRSKKRIKHIMHFGERILTRFVDHFVFISEGTKAYYQEQYGLRFKNNVSVIPTGVDVDQFSQGRIEQDTELSQEAKIKLRTSLYGSRVNKYDVVVGYIGTISKMREMTLYLQEHLDDIKRSNIFFVMIGGGDDLENLQNFIQENGLEDRFFVPGKMKQSELIQYMHSFDYGRCHLPDIFVFRNSFPLKILEYLSAGITILASKIKTHSELAKLHSPIKIYDTSNNMFEVIEQDTDTKTKSESVEKLQSIYDRKSLYKQYLDIYTKINEN